MPRQKAHLTTRRVGEPIRRFTCSEWELLEAAYGNPFSHQTRVDLTEALDTWSIHCGPMQEFTYGKDEARRVARISANADRLGKLVAAPTPLEDVMIRDAVSETECDLEKFLAMLAKLARMAECAEDFGMEEGGPEDLQISLLAEALRKKDYPVRVAKKSPGVDFTPSPFVRVIEQIWKLRPETRMHSPAGDKDASLSQWISERLRAERS